MRQLLCRLAWWVLWRWWPDRVVEIWNDGGDGWGPTPTKVLTKTQWSSMGTHYKDYIVNSSWSRAVEKLDHQGKELS